MDQLFVFGGSTLGGVLVLLVDGAPLLLLEIEGLEVVHLIGNLVDAAEDKDVAILVKSNLVAALLERLRVWMGAIFGVCCGISAYLDP